MTTWIVFLSLAALLLIPSCGYAEEIEPLFTRSDAANVCAAIYKAEGAERAKKPYGILSVPCSDKSECERICINTVYNNYKRYIDYAWRDYNSYLEFLASRYAPLESHPLNRNWLKNVKYFLSKQGG